MGDAQNDLDVFLTGIESKLRGPFSSLELSKAIATSALRDSLAPHEYLSRVSRVLSKTDKVTQMRILIGLLGLDPSQESDVQMDQIVTQAQEAPLYEEWVRVVSSLIQGILFEDEDGNTCRGREGSKMLEKTCTDVLKRVRKLERATNYESDDEDGVPPSRLEKADAVPTFAPYRYALLNVDILRRSIPETQFHAHFKVDDKAEIMLMDAKLEEAKALEEKEHATSLSVGAAGAAKPGPANGKAAATTAATFPGFRPSSSAATTKTASGKVVQRPKSSMFMPTKKPGQKPMQLAAAKAALHKRKAGAAQALLSKGKRNGMQAMAGGGASGVGGDARALGGGGAGGTMAGRTALTGLKRPGTTALGGARGRAHNKVGNARSKMMILDVAEVQELTKREEEKGMSKREKKLAMLKRKAPGAAANMRPSARVKHEHKNDDDDNNNNDDLNDEHDDNESHDNIDEGTFAPTLPSLPRKPASPEHGDDDDDDDGPSFIAFGAGALASAALSAYQAQVAEQHGQQQEHDDDDDEEERKPPAKPTTPAADAATTAAAAAAKQQDWREMLRHKSNRVTPEDAQRIQQFFVHHTNPTPEQTTYKMKLHEDRANDPKTGAPVKVTYYLELDYNTMTSKQSKKIKRYN